ncbi:MAG: nuclear transport factor 2 family protein [Pseudomonadota bacterium]
MSALDYQAFAKGWQAGWNSHDLDRILYHYCDNIVFHSRKALALTGSGVIHGKQALRAYWATALEQQPDLIFTVEDVFEGHEMMVITYKNHLGVLAAETLYFGPDGLVTQATACHRE